MLCICTLHSNEGSKKQAETKWPDLNLVLNQIEENCKAMLPLNLLLLAQQINNLERSGLNYWLRHVVKSLFENLYKNKT